MSKINNIEKKSLYIESILRKKRLNRKINFKTTFVNIIKNINDKTIKEVTFLDNLPFFDRSIFKKNIYNCIKEINSSLSKNSNEEQRKEIYENIKYSLTNVISKYTEIEEFYKNGSDLSFSIDIISGNFSLDICKKSVCGDYLIRLNLLFLPNGNVSFWLYDNDEKDLSYINGVITKNDTYMSSQKFRTILMLLNR